MDREMQWGSWNSVIERAKEELEILELEHPNKFEYLKMDLKAFISDFDTISMSITCPSAATQESSSRNKRKKRFEDEGNYYMKRRCKTDAVLYRAQQCLHKIQHLKTTL